MWLDKGDDPGQGPTDAKTSQWNMHPNNESPWAKPVRPGRNDDDRVLPVELLADPRRAIDAANDNLTSGVSFFVRLPHVCRDPASAADIKSVGLGPSPDVAGAR